MPCAAGFVPGAVRIPRQMLVLRSDALSRTHTKLVAYDSTDARSLQVRAACTDCLTVPRAMCLQRLYVLLKASCLNRKWPCYLCADALRSHILGLS